MDTLAARPHPLALDPARTAVIVVDMQNAFVAFFGSVTRAADVTDWLRSASTA